MMRRIIARTLGKLYDIYALQLLQREQQGFVAWTSSALRPGAVASIVNDIVINQRRQVVEFGSGISTLAIARHLPDATYSCISFEHDADWAKTVNTMLDNEGIGTHCRVVHAPLRPSDHSIDGSDWYDVDIVRNKLRGLNINLVLCDGPLADNPALTLSRYPAIPEIREHLAKDYAVYLDDIDRRGERKIARRWGQLLDVRFNEQLVRGSFAVASKGKYLNALI